MNVTLVEVTEKRFRRWPHTHPLLQGIQTAMRHPRHLRRKSLHMILLLLQEALRNKHGHIYVLHSHGLEPFVQLSLNTLPDGVSRRLDHHAALYVGIVNQFRFFYHIRIPLCKILIHGSDCFH